MDGEQEEFIVKIESKDKYFIRGVLFLREYFMRGVLFLRDYKTPSSGVMRFEEQGRRTHFNQKD